METQNTKFSKILKKIKSPEFAYLSVFFVFFIIVLILFLSSVDFTIKNVNKIFPQKNITETQAFNKEDYSLIVKKLNLPINTTEENVTQTPVEPTVTPPIEVHPIVGENPITTTETVAQTLDKKSISINILNTTSKKGVAATLAKTLENAGFSTTTTGNDKKSYNLTTIIISDAKLDYLPGLEEIVKTSYPNAVSETIANKTDFDVTIMIGKE